MVHYRCRYDAKLPSITDQPTVRFRMEIPAITTYPVSKPDSPGGLFDQLSVFSVDTESYQEVYPEELVSIVDRSASAPVYSFLSEEDQQLLIEQVHARERYSNVVAEEIDREVGKISTVTWHAVSVTNLGMLHSYSTFASVHKDDWSPFSALSGGL